jgi:tryptophan 2,3-dioxygenase
MAFDDRKYPPGKGALSYDSYLRVRELTGLQHLISDPPHHDEMLFIVIHQTYELWFKQLLHEVDTIAGMIAAGQTLAAARLLGRCVEIEKVLVEQVGILETMTPMDFLAFRERLAPASGFQSAQFRELEYALGMRDRRYLADHHDDSQATARLERRLTGPPLPEMFFALLRQRGFDAPPLSSDQDEGPEAVAVRERRVAALQGLYERFEFHYDLFLLAEALLELDLQLQIWRRRHVLMVERVIGGRHGTGGSSGAGYLKTTLEKRAFPELWDVRTSMSARHTY